MPKASEASTTCRRCHRPTYVAPVAQSRRPSRSRRFRGRSANRRKAVRFGIAALTHKVVQDGGEHMHAAIGGASAFACILGGAEPFRHDLLQSLKGDQLYARRHADELSHRDCRRRHACETSRSRMLPGKIAEILGVTASAGKRWLNDSLRPVAELHRSGDPGRREAGMRRLLKASSRCGPTI